MKLFDWINVITDALYKVYQGLISFAIAILILDMLGTYIDWTPFFQVLQKVLIFTQIFSTLVYLGLNISLKYIKTQFDHKDKIGNIDRWRVTDYWNYLNQHIVKDLLVWNGILITLCHFLV